MNEKQNLKIYISWQQEFIRHNQRIIDEYIKIGYPKNHAFLDMPKYMIELNKKRIYESQLKLSVLSEQGRF